MKRWVWLSCAALAAAGCAVGPPLEERLRAFVGRSEGDLVATLGVPERTYEAEGRKFLTFEDQRSYIVAGPSVYPGYGYSRFGPYFSPPGYVVRTCEITFAVRGGRVESFTFRGDGCR